MASSTSTRDVTEQLIRALGAEVGARGWAVNRYGVHVILTHGTLRAIRVIAAQGGRGWFVDFEGPEERGTFVRTVEEAGVEVRAAAARR